MSKGDKLENVAVWLRDEWARLILGASPPEKGHPSRWVALGSVDYTKEGPGIWLESGRIEEWKSGGERVAWKFSPPKLLILWPAVITVQVIGEKSKKKIGFNPPEAIPS